MEITLTPDFTKNYVGLEGSQKKEVVRRLDRVAETGSFGSNNTEKRNLEKGLIEIKFKSGVRVYGGIRKIGGKEVFHATVIGDKSSQSRDIPRATDLYIKAVEQDGKKPSSLKEELTFNEVSDMNKKQLKQYMLNKSSKTI